MALPSKQLFKTLSSCILKTSKTAISYPALQQQITSLLLTYKQDLSHRGENQDLQHPPPPRKKGNSIASSKGNCNSYSSLSRYSHIEIWAALCFPSKFQNTDRFYIIHLLIGLPIPCPSNIEKRLTPRWHYLIKQGLFRHYIFPLQMEFLFKM